jgi:hypothetical protein
MRWPWQRRTASQHCPSGDAGEATEARRRAEEELRRTHEQTGEVRELADRLRQHRRVNHFAELFSRSFEGRPR